MQTAKLNYLLVLIAFIWLSCESAGTQATGTTGTRIAHPPPSSITNFTLNIDSPTKTITVFLPQDGKSVADWLDTDLSNHILELTTITPAIQGLGLGYTSIAPASGTAQDFSFNREVDYTATKADGTTDTYKVRVRIKAADRDTLLELITAGITNTAKFGPTGNYNFIDTSEVTTMHDLFKGNTTFNGDITEWNVASVTTMDSMFFKATAFNKDIGNWNVARVQNMASMFYNAHAFNKDIGNWNVARVQSMDSMFNNAHAFNKDIGNWKVSSVQSMYQMFYNAHAFNKGIGNWDVASVQNMYQMFQNATAFNQDIGNWKVASVISMSGMFYNATAFNQDIGRWNVASVTSMSTMFQNAAAFNQDIGNWNVSSVISMDSMFQNATAFNQDIGNWDVAKVTSMTYMFYNARAFNQDLEDWKDHFPGGTPPHATYTFTGTPLTTTSTPSLPSWYTP